MRKVLAAALCAALLLGAVPAVAISANAAETTTISVSDNSDFTYRWSDPKDGKITLEHLEDNNATVLEIPNEKNGYTVDEIGYEFAQGNTNLKKVIIPKSVTKISRAAFKDCPNLTEIEFENGSTLTEIGSEVFAGTGVESIDIPDSVESIGSEAFSKCEKLSNIKLPHNTNYTTIEKELFYECYSLKEIEIPDNVTFLGSRNQSATYTGLCFGGCTSLEKVKLPNKLERIGSSCFLACTNLTTLEIPNTVTDIYDEAFSACGFKEINLPDNLTYLGKKAFLNCFDLKNITIPGGVETIEESTFENCNSLETVNTNPPAEGLKSIKDMAFAGCTSLEKIYLPFSVDQEKVAVQDKNFVDGNGDYFPGGAFWDCNKLTIFSYDNSSAHRYAENNGIKFESIGIYNENGLITNPDTTSSTSSTSSSGKSGSTSTVSTASGKSNSTTSTSSSKSSSTTSSKSGSTSSTSSTVTSPKTGAENPIFGNAALVVLGGAVAGFAGVLSVKRKEEN